jgi:hypothetical protein
LAVHDLLRSGPSWAHTLRAAPRGDTPRPHYAGNLAAIHAEILEGAFPTFQRLYAESVPGVRLRVIEEDARPR